MFNPHRQHHKISGLARPKLAAISRDSTEPSRSDSQLFCAIAGQRRCGRSTATVACRVMEGHLIRSIRFPLAYI